MKDIIKLLEDALYHYDTATKLTELEAKLYDDGNPLAAEICDKMQDEWQMYEEAIDNLILNYKHKKENDEKEKRITN